MFKMLQGRRQVTTILRLRIHKFNKLLSYVPSMLTQEEVLNTPVSMIHLFIINHIRNLK